MTSIPPPDEQELLDDADAGMESAASRPSSFTRSVLLRQTIVGFSALLVISLFAHKLIVLDWEVTLAVYRSGAFVAAVTTITTLGVSYLHLRAHRGTVRAIADFAARREGGSVSSGPPRAIEPEDLARLAALPNALTLRFLLVSAASSLLILAPGVRPALLDDTRAGGLVILTLTILAASALPHYVVARQAMLKLIEQAPLEPFTVLLESLEAEGLPERRVTQKLLLAVVPPVALLGAGAVLVAHAHLRTLAEESSRATAQLIARTALEPSVPGLGSDGEVGDRSARPQPGGGYAGASMSRAPSGINARETAIAAAAQLGFEARVEHESAEGVPPLTREPDGRLSIVEPLDDGRAIVRFTPDVAPGDTTQGAIIGLVAVFLASVLGAIFGRALTRDLVRATRSVRLLGTGNVLRSATRIARPARFAVVADLGRAIERLTERFRVFAAAQERALQARFAAQRTRGLLFASVSHDLKSPLNAILGFADLLETEELSAAQRESLGLISRRGRELLALIETILDAARVEARQLELAPRQTAVDALVAEATRKARELANQPEASILAEIADDLPDLRLDATYGPRAIAVILAHALRSAASEVGGRPVRVRVVSTELPKERGEVRRAVRFDVEYGRGEVATADLDALFAQRAGSSRARGITLALTLARSVIELHGGRVEVRQAPDGSPICQIILPTGAIAIQKGTRDVPGHR